MSNGLIQKSDDLLSLILRIEQPRCSITAKPGEWHTTAHAYIVGLCCHHLLNKKVYPHLRYERNNLIVLTDLAHTHAHDNEEGFNEWLEENRPEQWAWKQDHINDKQLQEIDLAEIFIKLKKELKEVESGQWMENEGQQIDPRQSRHGTPRIE